MRWLRKIFAVWVVLVPALAGTWAADLSIQERKAAKDLYDIKCAKCHKFYEPADYSQKDWDDWMKKMSRKSKLKPAQEELLTRYLGEYREQRK